MAKIIMLIGLPATGKSTYVRHIRTETEYVNAKVLSTDDNVLSLAAAEGHLQHYDTVWRKFIKRADLLYFDMLEEAVQAADNHIIIDRTNLSAKSRARSLQIIQKNLSAFEYVQAVVFGTKLPAITWLKYLGSRHEKTIPIDVLTNMARSYEPPSYAEGFDYIDYSN